MSACSHQRFDVRNWLNPSTRTESGAVESGSGAGEVKLAGQRPALQEPIDKSGVKDIAGSSRVHRLHLESGRVVELQSIPRKDAFVAQGCGGQAAAKPAPDCRQ